MHHLSDVHTTRYVYEFLRGLDCARSLTVWLLFVNNEHKQLATLEFIPEHYNTLDEARTSLAATKFLSKSAFLNTGINTQEVAMEKFYEAEEQCSRTNRRISRSCLDSTTQAVISIAREKIHQILGKLDFTEVIDACDWGPGATLLIKRRNATKPQKYLFETGITYDALTLISSFHFECFPRLSRKLEVVRGNKVITVPKNAKTDRTIAIEPGINLWYQKGIGLVLRKRLRRAGIDLNDQRHNQRLARLGSLIDSLATVDFSSASDTISKMVVWELLPGNWFHLLDAFRSSCAIVDGKPLYYEKFSSMGNGFTFELETLIFYAIALAVKQVGGETGPISVYGDDVILPSCLYPLYSSVCSALGFTVNLSKSYSRGPYRESCGKHYWNGVDIQPIFFKEPLDGNNSKVRQANAVRLLAHRFGSHCFCDRRLRRAWLVLCGSLYQGRKVPRVPLRLGDAGLISNIDEARLDYLRYKPHGWDGLNVKALSTLSRRSYVDHEGLLAFALRLVGTDSEPMYNQVPEPMHGRTVLSWTYVSQWDELGPWL